MFLNELNESERKDFMGLATIAIDVDGKVTDDEKAVLATYAYECKLPDYKPGNRSIEDILSSLQKSSPQIKKIVLIELLGIFAADKKWSDSEINMMYQVSRSFDIPDTMTNRLKRWSKEMREIIAEGYELIAR